MGEDIRFPIGGLFTILGLIMFIYGLVTNGSEIYTRSLGSNVNLFTGLGMLVFGVWFLVMALRKPKTGK